jgi:hypothetical protein
MFRIGRRRDEPPQEGKARMFADRTPEQIRESLAKAGAARAAKKELLDKVRSGELTLQELLGPEYEDNVRVQKMPVLTLLRALPGVGKTRADDAMEDIGIMRGRTVHGLGSRQREALLDWRQQGGM